MAIPNKTYNNLIDTLKELGAKHQQISTTTTGDIYDIDLEKNTLYPLMHINPINVATGSFGLTYNFQIFVMDLVDTDNANEQDVYNDVLQTCIDIISIFRNSKWQAQLALDINAPVYFTEGDYTLEPFTERFDQDVTGWVFQIGIVVANDFQSCEIPMEDLYIGQ
jgi:DNA-binding XRE family transcriptional regulator